MAVKVYMAVNRLNITLFSNGNPLIRNYKLYTEEAGAFGSIFKDFSLDSETISEVKSRDVNLDDFASFHNKIVNRYFSLGFQIENSGTNFSYKDLSLVTHFSSITHPLMFYYALLHASYFNAK